MGPKQNKVKIGFIPPVEPPSPVPMAEVAAFLHESCKEHSAIYL